MLVLVNTVGWLPGSTAQSLSISDFCFLWLAIRYYRWIYLRAFVLIAVWYSLVPASYFVTHVHALCRLNWYGPALTFVCFLSMYHSILCPSPPDLNHTPSLFAPAAHVMCSMSCLDALLCYLVYGTFVNVESNGIYIIGIAWDLSLCILVGYVILIKIHLYPSWWHRKTT